eukprot:6322339-Pyramimonas_sp.AAC.1
MPHVVIGRCVCTLAFVRDGHCKQVRTICLRLLLRGCVDVEAFDIETVRYRSPQPRQHVTLRGF